MQNRLTKVFQKAKYEENASLAEDVWQTIARREKRRTRFKLWIFALAGIASFSGLVPAFKILFGDLAQSGFYEYFSLVFSDGASHLSYWKEFMFSIAQSLPTMSILLSLSLIFVFFLSLKYMMKQIIKSQLILSF